MNNNTNRKSNCSEELSDVITEGIREDNESLTLNKKCVQSHISVCCVSLSIIKALCLGIFLLFLFFLN